MLDLDLCSARPDITCRVLRRRGYRVGLPRLFGPAGWVVPVDDGSLIVTQADLDGTEWLHASIAFPDRDPAHADLSAVKAAVFGDQREAYQVWPAEVHHVNLHEHALHLFGRADGRRVLPDFAPTGTI